MCVIVRPAGLQLIDWVSFPLSSVLSLSDPQSVSERKREKDGEMEPCLSVMEDSCLDAAFSNDLPENMIPSE